MHPSIYKEAADEILAAARARGHKITRAQLTRWHIFGILPRPIQRPRPGMRGTETVYPTGTIEQAIAATPLLRQRRSFDEVKIELWLLGYDISREYIACRLRDSIWPPFRLRDSIRKAFGKTGREIEAALGGDRAEAALKAYSDHELFDLWHREPGVVLRHAEYLVPTGHTVEWYYRVAFVARWLLASQLTNEEQRIAVAGIFLELLEHAVPVPGLAPTRSPGRPPARTLPPPRLTRRVAIR